MAERAWELPAVGGNVLDRWPDIAAAITPQLPDHVQAVAFHPESGQLDLRPASTAYATQLRLITARIVAAVNEAAGTDAVRAVRVLPVGAAAAPRTAPGPRPRHTAHRASARRHPPGRRRAPERSRARRPGPRACSEGGHAALPPRASPALHRPLAHPQFFRDHRGLVPASEPLASLTPDPFPELPPFRGQSAALRVPHTTGLSRRPPPDNTPERSVTRERRRYGSG